MKRHRTQHLAFAIIITATSMACGSALFHESFDHMALGTPPGAAETGTLSISGKVRIVAAPPPAACRSASGSSRWLQMNTPPAGVISAQMTEPVFSGTYAAAVSLCLSPNDGDFSLNVVGRRGGLIARIDLLRDGNVRIDAAEQVPWDDTRSIGQYSRGSVITVLAKVRAHELALSITSGGKTVSTAVRFTLDRTGFDGLDLFFSPDRGGSVYIDFIRVTETDG